MTDEFFNIGGLSNSSALYFVSRHFKSGLVIVPSDRDLTEAQETLSFFLDDAIPVHIFPAFEELYSLVKQDPEIVSERLKTQTQLLLHKNIPCFVISTLEALTQKTISSQFFEQFIIKLKRGEWIQRDALINSLEQSGYRRDSLAEDRGFFGVRGHLIDIFTFHHKNPLRIEFFGDEIVSIRFFDSESQRSLDEVTEIEIVPCSESLYKNTTWSQVRERLKNYSDENGYDPFERERILRDLEQHREPLEPRWILPALCEKLSTLDDYLPKNYQTIIFNEAESINLATTSMRQEDSRFEALDKLCFPPETLRESLDFWTSKALHHLNSSILNAPKTYDISHFEGLRNKIKISKNFQPLVEAIATLQERNIKTSIVIRNPKRALAIQDAITLPSEIEWRTGPLFEGFSSSTFSRAFITEKDIFGSKRKRQTGNISQSSTEDFLRQFSDLKHGDFVIHEDHGIAKFLGLQTLSLQGFENEFLVLEYQNADKLYLPVYRFDKVSRYVSEGAANPRLDRLGSIDFSKRKAKIKNDILKIAHELLQVAAQRKVIESDRASTWDTSQYQALCNDFPYELTTDQETAIEAIEKDFTQSWPMDRLICGDVGFGKTEVAIRAAMLSILQGNQVAVLAPTTLLAEQHYRNFKKRFDLANISVKRLSRFVSAAEQKKIVEEVKNGHVQLIIGTHRLLQSDIAFKKLGLLIIDEEQRFGVKHKERIKKMRSQLDVLTLSATPIPRTLQMSIVGIRDLSLIVTPPENREEVKTHVGLYDDQLIRTAIDKELQRGGQVLFVHNRVKTIQGVAERVQKLAPDSKIVIVHGQMPEDQLEKSMLEFISQKAQILVATSIIENGLDIPSANTLIVDHAEMFGLSELYQLRGRVGRSHQTASAYFLVHETTELTTDASKRLQVLASCTALGSGFRISTHDMEIRGAGNLLGEEQSGIIGEVGLELYTQMLEETLADISTSSHQEPLPEVNSGYSAFIPEAYVPDAIVRIATYKHLNRIRTPKALLDFESELLDRFGLYPKELDNLCQIMRIRTLAHALQATNIDLFPGRMTLQLKESTPLNIEALLPRIGKSLSIDQKGKLSFLFESAVKNAELAAGTNNQSHPELYDFGKCREFLKKILEESKINLESV